MLRGIPTDGEQKMRGGMNGLEAPFTDSHREDGRHLFVVPSSIACTLHNWCVARMGCVHCSRALFGTAEENSCCARR